ncbi:hypothetical protein PspCFBP13509_11545 [Pseudomonas sp. CFBP13509]|uniref:hypothetical protein n=1 Tax=Pseudomonas sp. CFBP13509 TaxID=2184008 RepID=UPI0010BFB2D6|nr:hypothetical protein [Pseudomonas sp. CFBP13509]TKJ79342.1 hypothetical protein PspCFBP13509_11545 [Pseudomonas sp. CFBP13509]
MDKQKKCIYCGSFGPFSDEHVFPAGMGGDDKDYILIDLVCVECNTVTFSKLELSLMRRSPTGLGRNFMQSKSRERGGQTAKPSIETRNRYVIDEFGRLLESEEDKNGVETILAQCYFEGEKIYYTAQDSPHLKKMYDALEIALSKTTINMIKKITSKSFEVTVYEWTNDKYEFLKKETVNKPPTVGIWVDSPSEKTQNFKPRFFQKLKGQLVLKTENNEGHTALLRNMRRTLPSIRQKHADVQPNTIENPIVQVEMVVDMQETERAIAKIGFNFFILTLGEYAANEAECNGIKSSILRGTPELPSSSFGEDAQEVISDLFGIPPQKCHCVMLLAIPSGSDTRDIYFNAKLYGSGAHKVLIARSTKFSGLEDPFYFIINYETNKIEKLSMLEYQLKHGTLIDRFQTNLTREKVDHLPKTS